MKMYKCVDGKNILMTEEEVSHHNLMQKVNDDYSTKRKIEYPSTQEQLDMIYWDKINGTNKWEELIKSIKEKYPKG